MGSGPVGSVGGFAQLVTVTAAPTSTAPPTATATTLAGMARATWRGGPETDGKPIGNPWDHGINDDHLGRFMGKPTVI